MVCQRAIKDKHKKYSLLIAMANAQKAEGIRPKPVKFLAVAASHLGELAPAGFELIERLCTTYTANPAYDPAITGVSKRTAVATFRETCKDSTAVAVAKGSGRMMAAACSTAAWVL